MENITRDEIRTSLSIIVFYSEKQNSFTSRKGSWAQEGCQRRGTVARKVWWAIFLAFATAETAADVENLLSGLVKAARQLNQAL